MLNSPRWLLALVSISFGVYHAVLGALAWRSFDDLAIHWLSIGIYVLALVISVSASKGLQIGRISGLIVAVGAVSTVITANSAIHHGHVDPYATWYVGAMAALLGILAARGQSLLAWLATGAVFWLTYSELGPTRIGEAGLEGIVILIGAATATAFALKRADLEISQLQETELRSQAGIVGSQAASEERVKRLNIVLEKALPALSFISASKGELSAEQQSDLLKLEASLRDDIRGRSLLNDAVREAADQARKRGVEVVILDEGGLAEVNEVQLEHILKKVASAIGSVQTGKVVIRSPRGEKWLVTVMATRPGTAAPDLWLRL